MRKVLLCVLALSTTALAQKKKSEGFFEYENPYEERAASAPVSAAPQPVPVTPKPQPQPKPEPIPSKTSPVEKKIETRSAPEAEAPVVVAPTHGSDIEDAPTTIKKISDPDPKLPLEQRLRFKGEGPSANWWKGIKNAPRTMEFGSVSDPNNPSVRRNGVFVTRANGGRYFVMNSGYRAPTRAGAAAICKGMTPKGRWKLATQYMKFPLSTFQAERDGLSGGDETMWMDHTPYLVSVLGFNDPTYALRNGRMTEGLFTAPVNYGGGNVANTQSGSAAVAPAYRGKFDLYAKKGGLVFCATGDVPENGY